MQCDETISHMVTASWSYFRTLRNACVTAGKIYHGCFEMLSWPHRTSANIITTCFWLLETCTKCSYFIEENIRPGAQRLAFEVKYEYIVRRPRIYRVPVFCGWASFQTTCCRCVNCTWKIKACRCSSSIRCRMLRAYEKMTHLTRRRKNDLTQMRTQWLSCCLVLSFFDL